MTSVSLGSKKAMIFILGHCEGSGLVNLLDQRRPSFAGLKMDIDSNCEKDTLEISMKPKAKKHRKKSKPNKPYPRSVH